MTLFKIDYIPPTGIDDFDQHVINPFNQRAETINAMNFEFEREEAEQAGAIDYLEALDSLDDNWLYVNQARLQIIEYGEAVKKQRQPNHVTKQTQHAHRHDNDNCQGQHTHRHDKPE